MLYVADCSEQVGTEQQGKTGFLPGLLNMSATNYRPGKKKKKLLGYVHAKTRWS